MHLAAVLIPARFKSTRFPGKPLVPLKGKPMIQWVWQHALASGFPVYVVTDDQRIEDCVRGFGGEVIRVDDDVPSGTERIALAAQRKLAPGGYRFFVNVQGDEPLLKGASIRRLVEFHAQHPFDVTTLVRARMRSEADWNNPNVVKAVMGTGGRVLYFSRASVPFERDGGSAPWFQHIGVYCYRSEALDTFVRLPESTIESFEKLEQLRALEAGMSFGAVSMTERLVGVDTPEDVAKAEEALGE